MPAFRWSWGLGALVLVGCAAAVGVHEARPPVKAASPPASHAVTARLAPAVSGKEGVAGPGVPSQSAPASTHDTAAEALSLFQTFVQEQGDLDYPDLEKRLGLAIAPDKPMPFDPTAVRYYAEIAEQLKLTEAEKRIFRQQGIVGVDHKQRYSMGSAYYAIYTRDLPVLVTSDSILHAFHRSFDQSLKQLEAAFFSEAIDRVLSGVSNELVRDSNLAKIPELRQSLEDLDLYVTVARGLLKGAGAPQGEAPARSEAVTGAARIEPARLADQELVDGIFARVTSLKIQTPMNGTCTQLYGGERFIDWSQYKPRGHYTESTELRRYFRAMMWLGRVDSGFNLRLVDPVSGLRSTPTRELRNAALFVMMLDKSGQYSKLASVGKVIDFMVGRSDNVSIPEIRAALVKAGLTEPAHLAERAALDRLDKALDEVGVRAQQIRGQVVSSDPSTRKETGLPLAFQVFGQRFVVDSFVLSRVVYDGILYRGEKQDRMMPKGFDAMAALGNDEAVRLLEPDLDRYHYASNLLAARRVVDAMKPEEWRETAYNQWLATFRTLDDVPKNKFFPHVMTREAWRRKQLQTVLASWAELRHDTILYAKPSYTAGTACVYPAGYVEPYPAFFEGVRDLSRTLSARIGAAEVPEDLQAASYIRQIRDQQKDFFANFAKTMERLTELAKAELAGRPFTKEQTDFLKKTIDIRGGGSGGPYYTGWYTALFFRGRPDHYKPTVADVHTDPDSEGVLHEAVGDVNFVVAAIDNGKDRAAYVGPIFSYYEFAVGRAQRMTDDDWSAAIEADKMPPRPEFTSVFQAPAVKRELERRVRPAPPRRPSR